MGLLNTLQDLVRELGLAEDGGDGGEGGRGQTPEDEKDTAARIEDKANEKANGNGASNGARRRSRSRSRSRPPALETVEENYSKEVQESLYYKQEGLQQPKLHDIKECPSGASIQSTASGDTLDKHLSKGQTTAETLQGQAEVAKDDDAKQADSLDKVENTSKGPLEEPMSLKDEAKLDIESEEMERKGSATTATGTI